MSVHFLEMTQEAFAFLERTGFRITKTDPTRLQYETTQVFVTVEWDIQSGELNVFIGRQSSKAEPGNAFSLTDLLSMEGVNAPNKQPFQVAEQSKLRPFLDELAEDLQMYARPALAGDRMFFRRLATFRAAQAQANMREMQLRHVRTQADKAWHDREFDKVIVLYSSMEDQLTSSEKAKLAYAKQHQTTR